MSSRLDLIEIIDLIETNLPGWWWRVGTCYLSDDAALGPDYNDPTHRERLLKEFPVEIFDGKFDVDLRPAGDLAGALHHVYDLAVKTIEERKP